MVHRDSLKEKWMTIVAKQHKSDPILIEKVVRALYLLEHLQNSELEFIFKGGTALMLLLKGPKRFSIDIDIIVSKKPENMKAVLDPPYLGKRTNGYSIDANDKVFHKKLLRLSNRAKCMIFISSYENDFYNSILGEKNGWEKKTIDTVTKDSKGNSHDRTEVVWMNKYYINALKTQELPIKLTEKEMKQGKVNPIRK